MLENLRSAVLEDYSREIKHLISTITAALAAEKLFAVSDYSVVVRIICITSTKEMPYAFAFIQVFCKCPPRLTSWIV